MGRHAAPSHRKSGHEVPAAVRETLLWGCFAAVIALVVIVFSGAPIWVAVGSGIGLFALAGAAYVLVRWTGLRLHHLDRPDQH